MCYASDEFIYKVGESEPGPDLPNPLRNHVVVPLSESVTIIIGGWTPFMDYSDQTWYFNHASQEFMTVPNMLEGRNSHSSGTITDQITKEKFVIVVGGYNGSSHLGLSYSVDIDIHSYSDSTEILMNGEWVKGKISYKLIDLLGFCTFRISIFLVKPKSTFYLRL